MTHAIPTYYQKVHAEVHQRWNRLKDDPELAAPWYQLFRQLKSDPRHVLSELLQNADDAGATWARATVSGNSFRFEHNGRDFNESDFRSLCSFGISNKRFLHTIGFRGIGFKTTFSLGAEVDLLTPSLSVRFHEDRFTEPTWLDNSHTSQHTVVEVRIDSAEKEKQLTEHFTTWADSAIPLLFFQNIESLEIQGVQLEKRLLEAGPVPNSQVVQLMGNTEQRLICVMSAEEAFPADAIEEIRKERGGSEPDQVLPPCKVEIILGLSGEQRLYVVLPTNVTLALPFSCNAPFIQDPARTGIKAPSASPTNRWLLARIGKLAAAAFESWLGNTALPHAKRAESYENLLLDPELIPEIPRSIGQECSKAVADQYEAELDAKPIILTTDQPLVRAKDCLPLPPELLQVWSPAENLELFAQRGETFVLSPHVSRDAKRKLEAWKWLTEVDYNAILDRLMEGPLPPRPKTDEALAVLWSTAADYAEQLGYPYSFSQSKLAIVPVRGSQQLHPSRGVMVAGAGEKDLSQSDWEFLAQYIPLVDSAWLQRLTSAEDALQKGERSPDDRCLLSAARLLRDLELASRRGLALAVELAAKKVFSAPDPGTAGIQLAYIAARADVRVPDSFRYRCEDGQWRKVSEELLVDVGAAASCIPPDWRKTHLLHPKYGQATEKRDRNVWERWSRSPKSRLHRFPLPTACSPDLGWFSDAESFFVERGGHEPSRYALRERFTFVCKDWDFDESWWQYWEERARSNPDVWKHVLLGILEDWGEDWNDRRRARVRQKGYYISHPIDHGVLAAAWLHRLRGLPCLPDRHGRLELPIELYRVTPDTTHLHDIELFIHPSLDREAYHEPLDLLGVRSKPDSADKVVERIRSLSQADPVPGEHLRKLYRTLDHCTGYLSNDPLDNLRREFSENALIHAEDGTWHTSSGIFQENPEELPDIPVIPKDLRSLPLWKRLGVPDQPTLQHRLQWLKRVPQQAKLAAPDARRVRALLGCSPIEIWNELGCWLDAAGSLQPVVEFRWRTDNVQTTPTLFPWVRLATADVSMLSPEQQAQAPFNKLPLLTTALEHRLVDFVPRESPFQPDWLAVLGQCIYRIEKPSTPEHDTPDNDSGCWRAAARRLASTHLQKVDSLRVTPYIEGQPVGDPRQPNVLWHESLLYLTQEPHEVYDELVLEIQLAFDDQDVKAAIQTCADRASDWIRGYFEKRFPMAPITQQLIEECQSYSDPENMSEVAASEESVMPWSDEKDLFDDFESIDEEDIDSLGVDHGRRGWGRRSKSRPGGSSLLARHFVGRGYRFDESLKGYVSTSGVKIRRSSDNIFHWEELSNGAITHHYWVGTKSLEQGVELPTEVWEMLKEKPAQTSLLLPDGYGSLRQYSGIELVALREEGKIELFPAMYRLTRVG